MMPLSYWIAKGRALRRDFSVTGASLTSAIFFKTPSNARSVIGFALSGFSIRVASLTYLSISCLLLMYSGLPTAYFKALLLSLSLLSKPGQFPSSVVA